MGNETTGKFLLNLLWHQNNIQPLLYIDFILLQEQYQWLFGIENGHISKTKQQVVSHEAACLIL